MSENRITEEEMVSSLGRAGYFLETRVLEKLAEHKYENTPNATYPDSITGKSRELDILTEGPRLTDNIKLNHSLHFEFQHNLIVECVNNTQPVVFFKRPDKSKYTVYGKFRSHHIVRDMVEEGKNYGPKVLFHEITTESKNFHYNDLSACTQYCSFSKKRVKDEWMASHPDGLHDTFNKLFDSTTHRVDKVASWMEQSAWRDSVFVFLGFPVLVLQGDLFETSQENGKVVLNEKKHIMFEFSRYTTKSESLLVDVIVEDYLEEYLKKVGGSMEAILKPYRKLYRGSEIVEFKFD